MCVEGDFCPARPHSHLDPRKHTEAYINYKLFGWWLRLLLAIFLLIINPYLLVYVFPHALGLTQSCPDLLLSEQLHGISLVTHSLCSSSQTSCLLALPILPAWLMVNQHLLITQQEKHIHSIQKDIPHHKCFIKKKKLWSKRMRPWKIEVSTSIHEGRAMIQA